MFTERSKKKLKGSAQNAIFVFFILRPLLLEVILKRLKNFFRIGPCGDEGFRSGPMFFESTTRIYQLKTDMIQQWSYTRNLSSRKRCSRVCTNFALWYVREQQPLKLFESRFKILVV
ncbi:hypothetical protein B6V75_18295 [Thioclava sp. F1Mire-8]|nr:hypothetical protein B6V75_18295 [Thioclava sp. F1Mire-8]